MQRYKLTIEYFGSKLYGWQGQQEPWGLKTVQSELEYAIEKLAGKNNFQPVVPSSRTDSGVHALANVCHVDIQKRHWKRGILVKNYTLELMRYPDTHVIGEIMKPFEEKVVFTALNSFLHSSPVSIRKVEKVSQDFHARFNATGRKYVYRIMMLRPDKELSLDVLEESNVFQHPTAWYLNHSLDVEAMKIAASYLVGTHDFTSFRASHCQALTPLKTLSSIDFQVFQV